MKDSATSITRFKTSTPLELETAFDGGRLTSDGGLVWLAEVDEELGLCEKVAHYVPEWRGPSVRHSLSRLVRQRVFQIACGYEDQNDSDTLRTDPLLKLVCGTLPETGKELASQPTISRLENAADARSCYRIAGALLELYIRQRASDGAPPARILLDFVSMIVEKCRWMIVEKCRSSGGPRRLTLRLVPRPHPPSRPRARS